MIKSKSVDLLHILSQREFKKLGEFLNSPLHNKNRRLVELYGILEEYHPGFSSDGFTKQTLYSRLFPGEKYRDNMMRKVLSELSSKILEFLAYINFTQDRLEQNKHLMSELNKRNADKYFEESFKDAEDALQYSFGSEEMLDYKHSLEFEKNTSFLKKNKFLFDESLLNESNYLIKYFLLKILRRYTQILNKQIYELSANYKLDLLDEILQYLKANKYDDIPAIQLYYNLVMLMLNEHDEQYLINVKITISEKESLLEKLDIYNAYFIMNNYYRKKLDNGSITYVSELFGLYRTQLSKDIYKIEKYIHPTLFLNIVRTGTRLKKFDWIENFICCYIHEIEPNYRENTLNFSMAMLNFFRKNYNESMDCLSRLKFNGYYHKLDVYCYMLRIYYELNETEPLISLIDTYKHVLSKDRQIPEFKKSEYKSFIKFLGYLIKMKMKDDYSRVTELKRELVKVHSVSCTGWFWEKFTELDTPGKLKHTA